MKKFLRVGLITALLTALSTACVFADEAAVEAAEKVGEILPIWSVIPFVGMLLSIAIFPLVASEFWEKHQLKIALGWSLLFLIPFGIAYGGGVVAFKIAESVLVDYLPFIVLLFGLFVASGGIVLKGSIVGTTKVNVIMLLIGTVLASWIGTTGAAMLMIRPIIKANAWREKKAHIIIFFIFMVANIGGCLTPVGDPPLFLGFLRGVPFFWTIKLLPIMILNIIILTVVFIIMDKRYVKKELAMGNSPVNIENAGQKEPIRVEGAHNFIFILMIVGAVILNGMISDMDCFKDPTTVNGMAGITVFGATLPWTYVIQIGIILLAAVLSLVTTKKSTREFNEFTYAPIAEVAKLFIGIFLTMIPALAILGAKGSELGFTEPWQFFWITGALSSFLDNAPTYLVFMTTAGSLGAAEGLSTMVGTIAPMMLVAISAGAVFMGANTYIGNAPNFMVKSIAEENKIKMPSFFGYMAWSISILIPVFIIDTFLFFILQIIPYGA